jgi:hypothetical protein
MVDAPQFVQKFGLEPRVMKLPRVDEFDALRGVLAMWVAITHILCYCGFATLQPPPS